jgi:hypothetical protein
MKRYYLELPHDAHTSHVTLKFAQPSKVRLREGKFASLGGPPEEQEKLTVVNALFERFKISRIEGNTLNSEEEVEHEKEEMERLTGKEFTDLNLLYTAYVEHLSDEDKLDFINGLNALEMVEAASFLIQASLKSGPLIRVLELLPTT